MKHLVMVGACYLDTILSVPHFPAEDAKLRATSQATRRGGNGGNSLEVLQQFASASALALHLVTTLPNRDCAATAKVLSSFGSDGRVDLSHCIHREDQTEAARCYVIRSEATGSRTIVTHSSLADMTPEEFEHIAETFREDEAATWWHFEGRVPETTLQCVQYLRRHLPRSRVSIEVEKPGRDGLRDLASEADVVFYSRSWAEGEGYASAEACLTGEAAPKAQVFPGKIAMVVPTVCSSRRGSRLSNVTPILTSCLRSLTVCTWGARGACARPLPGREVIQVEPARNPAVQVVDAIGAGDTFIAGIMYGLLCRTGDWGVESTVKFAVDLATVKVQQDGFEGLASKLSPAG